MTYINVISTTVNHGGSMEHYRDAFSKLDVTRNVKPVQLA